MSDVSIVDKIWAAKTQQEYYRDRSELFGKWACLPCGLYVVSVLAHIVIGSYATIVATIAAALIAVSMMILGLRDVYKSYHYGDILSDLVSDGASKLSMRRRKRWLSKGSEDLYVNLMDELLCQECHIGNECPLCDTPKQGAKYE